MKLKIIISYLLLSLTILIWTSCTGPMGPAGYDGRDGLNGRDGVDGNANVTTSPWFTSPGWKWDDNDKVWFFDKMNSAITKDIVENGIVLAYINVKGDVINDNTVRPLPAYAIQANWDFLFPNDGNTGYGTIEFTTTLTSDPGNADYFRYVLIPSGYILKSARLKSTKVEDLRKMPYSKICELLNIKD
jgi:hypothetical protein